MTRRITLWVVAAAAYLQLVGGVRDAWMGTVPLSIDLANRTLNIVLLAYLFGTVLMRWGPRSAGQ
jgi:hypothetical protein